MFKLALGIGLYSYSIFLLGVLHLLTKTNILIVTLVFCTVAIKSLKNISFRLPKFDKFSRIFLALLITQLFVNLIGTLGPEIGFDALWYHLTLPKIWLQRESLIFISGSQFKYSVMPMLTEMFYFIFPGKLIHYLFGALSLFVTYKLARKFLNIRYSIFSILIFSSNLVFGWQQTSAYVDLSRTFFEILALYFFIDNKIFRSAIVLGLAVSTKLLSLSTLPIFLILLLIKRPPLRLFLSYCFLVILVVSPWLIRSYYHTGNLVYPFFTPLYTDTQISLDPRNLLALLTRAADPIHPIYLIILFLLPILKTKNLPDRQAGSKLKIIVLYSLLSLILWILTPNTGGGRFILPYLPALSIVAASLIYHLKSKALIIFCILYSVFSISYRFAANLKYLQPKERLLRQKLAFNFGDYYDFDHFFKPTDRVLTIGINNLFYLDAYIAMPPENFDYLLIRGSLPDEFKTWKLVNQNAITNTKVYAKPDQNLVHIRSGLLVSALCPRYPHFLCRHPKAELVHRFRHR